MHVQLFIPEPSIVTTDLLVSGVVKGNRVDSLKALFGKHFQNKLQAMSMKQQGAWGQPVEIAAKVDLSGMDSKNLLFYSYNKATNKYAEINNPNYWVDKNAFLHFTTDIAGDIIISEGELVKK